MFAASSASPLSSSRSIKHLEDRKIYDVYYWEEAREQQLAKGWKSGLVCNLDLSTSCQNTDIGMAKCL